MKQYYFLFALLFASASLFSQNECPPATAFTTQEWNELTFSLKHSYSDFSDPSSSWASFEFPPGSGTHLLFTSGMIISGVDAGGQIHAASQLYANESSFAPGPLSLLDATLNPESCQFYDRFWLITREQVELHLAYFACANDPNCTVAEEYPDGYDIPEDFLSYPAHGNPALNEAFNLAPFFDSNEDGLYDPADGDCPLYADLVNDGCGQGLLGDVTLYWIENDRGSSDLGSSIGIEVHNMAYAYYTDDPVLDQTLFLQREIHNRGALTLNNTTVGHFIDFDLGNYADDYQGCDVGNCMAYCYNGDADDEFNYGETPPAVGLVQLRGPLQDADGEDNDDNGVIDDETLGMGSFMAVDLETLSSNAVLYNTMNSLLPNGQALIYSGTDAVVAKFMYPGNSDQMGIGTGGVPQEEWYEFTDGNAPHDVRSVMSSEPFTLSPGATHKVNYAYIVRTFDDSPTETVGELQEYAVDVQELFDNCASIPASIASHDFAKVETLSLWPNPATAQVNVNGLTRGARVQIINSQGQIVREFAAQATTQRVSLEGLATGCYLLQTTSEKRQESQTLIVR